MIIVTYISQHLNFRSIMRLLAYVDTLLSLCYHYNLYDNGMCIIVVFLCYRYLFLTSDVILIGQVTILYIE